MAAVLRPSGGNGWEVECPPRSIVRFETRVFRDHLMLAEPLYRDHVVNGSLWESATIPLRFSTGDAEHAWSMELVSNRHTVTYNTSNRLSPGVHWVGSWTAGPHTVTVGEYSPFYTVLHATGADGNSWKVAVRVQVEPLTPQYLFEGAMAGQGEDWEATAKHAVSLQKKAGDE